MKKVTLLLAFICAIAFFAQSQSLPMEKITGKTTKEKVKTSESAKLKFLSAMQGIPVDAPKNNRETPPAKAPDNYIKHCGANCEAAILDFPIEFAVAARWTAYDLADAGIVSGDMITNVKIVPWCTPGYTFLAIQIYQGSTSLNDAGTLVYEQELVVSTLVSGAENVIELTTPVIINSTQELWVGYSVAHEGYDYFSGVGYDCGPRVPDKGDLIYIGGEWWTMYEGSEGDLSCNWNIEAYVATGNPALAKAPANFTLTPIGTTLAADLSWTNPSQSLNGNALSSITKMVLQRDGATIQEFSNPTVGATMNHTDNAVPSEGTHEYKVYAVTSEGNGLPATKSAIFGEFCNIIIHMQDDYEDGWDGGSKIDIHADGAFVGSATLTYGATGTATILCPINNLTFTWVSGGTNYDDECHFQIYDAYDMFIYENTTEPVNGIFLTYNNTCIIPTMNTISGNVSSSAGGITIADAIVKFAGALNPTATTNSSGYYSVEVVGGQTYNITVEATGYVTYTETAYVAIGSATKNFALAAPKIHVSPNSVSTTTSYGIDTNATVSISNTGDAPLNWSYSPNYKDKGKSDAKDAWDLVYSFTLDSNMQPGIATDGNYIYTSFYGYEGRFVKYEMDGTFVESFTISGITFIIDLAYDGTYFYGGNGTPTLFIIDLENKSFIGTISTTITNSIIHCSYDEDNDEFWIGSWNDLCRINRSGETTVASVNWYYEIYSSAYDNITPNGPYILLFGESSSSYATVFQYDIANAQFTSFTFDFDATPGYDYGEAHGAFIAEYEGKICFFGNVTQYPQNIVGIYELGQAGWLKASPTIGTIPAGGSQTVTLTMDGSWAPEGTFHADAIFKTKNPNIGNAIVDVTFTIYDGIYPVSISPTDGATNVGLNKSISVTFSSNITANDLSGISISPNPGGLSASISENVLTIAHSNFGAHTNYTVNVPAGAIAEYSDAIQWSFTTGSGAGVDDYTDNVKIYPNPTSGTVNIEVAEKSSVKIFNISGKIIDVYDVDDKAILNLNQTAGIYFIRVESNGKRSTHKIVVSY